MREAVGADTHTTAAAVVKAVDALWDARGSHDPTVAPHSGKRGDKKRATPVLKVAPLPALISIHLKTLVMVFVNFTTTMPTRLTGAFRPVLGQKTN
jgi:hypothetical protein